ncbi:lysine biosynthesis regulatory protein Lys14p [Monosporozyma servazzii]
MTFTNHHKNDGSTSPNTGTDKSHQDSDFQSVLSHPGNYMSPASIDSRSSFTNASFDSKFFVNTPSTLSSLNASSHSLTPVFGSRVMASSDILGLKDNLSQNSVVTDIIASSSIPSSSTSSKLQDINADSQDKKNNNLRRKYSRNGCTECKRRRMKCDETKPTCWQCSRLNRDCVYILNRKNKKRKPSTKSVSSTSKVSKDDKKTKVTPISYESTPDQINEASSELIYNNPENNISTTSSERVVDVPNLVSTSKMDGFDANLLMQNLNDIVNMKLNDSVMLNESLKNYDFPDLDIPELLPSNPSHANSVPISFLVNNVIQFNIKITSFKLGGAHDEYLRIFYNDCLNSIAPFFQNQGNPLRDILLSFARNESYLLSAILAIGASIAHRKSNKLEDEKSYCAYLSHCLNLLGEQFHNESNVLNKIEPIILTVILLAWDCIYTMNSQWRSHLKGVTDLFKKINKGDSSKVLNVAKCWFKVMETFASISTVLGGSFSDEDLELIFDPYDYQYVDSLKFLNVMTPLNEFNLLRGHKEDLDIVIKEVIRSLNSIRSSQKEDIAGKDRLYNKNVDYLLWSPTQRDDKDPLSYFNTQNILVEINKQLDYEFISKTGIIPKESQSHPDNSHIDDNAIDIVILRNGERIALSWYDISHQTQALSFLLIVLLKLLGIPRESITIQQVVKRIMSFFSFLDSDDPPRNARTCYSNFAVLLAGLNSMDERTRDLVRKYFKLNRDISRRLTEHNLVRLEKVWSGANEDCEPDDQDILTW